MDNPEHNGSFGALAGPGCSGVRRWGRGGGRCGVGVTDVDGHQPFGPIGEFKLDPGPFLEGFEPFHLDGREVCKGIGAPTVGLDKAEAFGIVEPFDCTAGHGLSPLFAPV